MRDTTKYFVLLSFLILFLSHQTFPQTHIQAGNVSGKWLKQNSPYFIDGEIKILRGKKLIIEPGVKVIFKGHYKFIVNGILEAKGTKQDSIYFFSSDTAVGWHGVRFIEAEDFSELEYCVLKYGKTTLKEMMKKVAELNCNPGVECCDELDAGGGAIYVNKSNPVINRCKITNNVAGYSGGGIDIINNSNPIIRYCQITNNSAREGGGIKCTGYSNPLIKNCYISENTCGMGGGIYIGYYSNAMIDSCIILNNIAKNRGGGISFYTSAKPVIKNSTISSNSSPLGAGIYIDEFYNDFREQPDKIDIRIINVKIDNNTADYGGGIWVRDSQGELSGVTICNNRAIIGGGIHIEHNPSYFKFSSENLCNIYMNFARMMGNDLFRLGGDNPIKIPLDTFTVKYYSSLNVEPVEKFFLTTKNSKLTQVDADLYVDPDGDDSNSGLSPDEPLKSLKIALLRILADSTNPHTIFLNKGEYIFTETNDILLLDKHKYVSVEGRGFTEVIFSTDRIKVLTPWWIATWALIIYSSVAICLIILIANIRTRRIRIKAELDKKEFEAHKLQEIDEIKTKFFTNISHEFRTPLTLILGPAKLLLEKLNDEDAKAQANLIQRSAKNLNRLVDELLDISKIEAGEMKLKACPVNIVVAVKDLSLSFYPLAERKKITFRFNSCEDDITIYLDRDKFNKIITNVLSNAFKFTPEGGEVLTDIKRKGKDVQIIISDTGIGIPLDQIDKIFDRFYQVDSSHTREQEGTGIGLALTKELVELHKGKIEVESAEGKGSTFRLIFPLGKDHLKPEEIYDDLSEIDNKVLESEEEVARKEELKMDVDLSDKLEKPSLLIVEDNSDVRKYIIGILKSEYHILEAKDGEEGLIKSFEIIPELIISDIMMPKIDGFQLVSKLKSDSRTSHIPIILLTAKATVKDKVTGLELGADEYVMKPFEAEELKARIKNLLDQRKRLHEHFRKFGLVEIEEKKINSTDQQFLQKVISIINEHIPDTTFGVKVLAENMFVSRSLLIKKIEALIGETPHELIRRIRLNKAIKLIENYHGNISEIALEVGFNNPSYFAECFKKQFGVAPTKYHSPKSNS